MRALSWMSLALSTVLAAAFVLSPATVASATLWDDFNSRVWSVGIQHDADIEHVTWDWIDDGGRQALYIRFQPDSAADSNYLLAFTNRFPPESLESISELRFDLKWTIQPPGANLKLEGKGLSDAWEDDTMDGLFEAPMVIPPSDGYSQHSVPIDTGSSLSQLVFVFDQINGSPCEIYLSNLRFVRNDTELVWDDFADPSRFWVPAGWWLSWLGPHSNQPIELISRGDRLSDQPSGGLYLRWDPNGRGGTDDLTAEIKSEGNSFEAIANGQPPPGLDEDFTGFATVSADVVCTNRNPIGVFIGHFADGTTDIEAGFVTPAVRVQAAGVAQRITWDLPWPPGFPTDDVDVISFVVQDVRADELGAGEIWIDNVELGTRPIVQADTDHDVWTLFDFDAHTREGCEPESDSSGIELRLGWLAGDIGEFSPDPEMTSEAVQVRHETSLSANLDAQAGGSLSVEIDLTSEPFAGQYFSLIGRSSDATMNLDLTRFSQIQFSIRAHPTNSAPLQLKIEIKDYRDALGDYFDAHSYTAYRYITVPAPAQEVPGGWTRIVLDADITDPAQWRFNQHPPDPTRAKLLVVTAEPHFNQAQFGYFIDDVALIHATDESLQPAAVADDPLALEQILDRVQRATWRHFDRWVTHGTSSHDPYLYLDRSAYPDLVSTAATGFGIAALVVAHHRGWISDASATDRVLQVLRSVAEAPMVYELDETADVDEGIGFRGWLWHFLGIDGRRKVDNPGGGSETIGSELSSVDTAILLWGALAAEAYFASEDPTINPSGPSSSAPEISQLVDTIYRRIDFRFMVDPVSGQICLGWKPEQDPDSFEYQPEGAVGYFSGTTDRANTWDRMTDELVMIMLLGIASPEASHRLPADMLPLEDYLGANMPCHGYASPCEADQVAPVCHSFFGSGFTYFFQQSFLRADWRMSPLLGLDLLENARRAAMASWLWSRCRAEEGSETFAGGRFGVTAAENLVDCTPENAYGGGWGTPPRESDGATDNGTLAPYGALSFLQLWPRTFTDLRVESHNPSIDALLSYVQDRRLYNPAIGLVDAFNLDFETRSGLPLINPITFAIDNGPMLMSIENYRSGLFWRLNLICRQLAAAGLSGDHDRDGRIDLCDNCPSIANASQADRDRDGIGDRCDPRQANRPAPR